MSDSVLNMLRSANPSSKRFFSTINELRKKTSTNSYKSLFSKIKRVRPLGRNTLIPAKSQNISKIAGIIPIESLPFEKEVAWTSLQISENLTKLDLHVSTTSLLSKYVGQADFIGALDVLSHHKKFYGETLWGIEAKIGILSRKDFSSEEVTQYLDSRLEVSGSIADYLAYLFLDLYDEDTSLGGFQRRMNAHLKQFTRSDLRNFINVKALSLEGVECSALSDFIRVNSSFGIVDAYESVIKAIPQYFFYGSNINSNQTILSVLSELIELDDPRLIKIYETLRYSVKSMELEKFSEDGFELHGISTYPDFRKISIAALCTKQQAESINIDSSGFNSIERQFTEILLSFNDKDKDLISTYEEIQTFASKYYFLPWFPSAKSWIDGIFMPFIGEMRYLLYRASSCFYSSNYSDLRSIVYCLPWLNIYEALPAEQEIYLKNSLALLSEQDDEVFESPLASTELLKYGNQLLLLTSALAKRNEQDLLKICVEVAITNIGSSTFLPFEYIFEDKETWEDLQTFNNLDVIIGLYFASIWDRESRNRFLLEFSCKKIIPRPETGLSDSILELVDAHDLRVMFILREILVPKNLRLVGGLRTVEDLERFRINICATMLDVDKEFKDKYVAETMEILQTQDMRKAEKDIESARINVDREGLKHWAEKTYREEFLRAKKARTIKMAPSIEEIEKNFTENLYAAENKDNSTLAQNLKDPIFIIASEVFNECFWKEDYGLDHFLSLRIRHGSFAGYLRAPLEQFHLLSTGSPTSGITRDHWRSSLSQSSESSLNLFLASLNRFQLSFDAIVEHFRSDLLQIATPTKPLGLFVPGLHKALWDAYHLDWEGAPNFDKFFDFIWDAFQEALNASLKIVINSIDEKILSGSENLLANLRRTVIECGLEDLDRANLVSTLNDGVISLQEAVKSVKKWFEVKRDPVSDTTLNAQQTLELALKLFKKIRPNFTLDFTPKFESKNIVFNGSNISRVTDALFIVFDNIYKHSGFNDVAEINFNFNWVENTEKTGFVNISISSPISIEKDISLIHARLSEIRSILQSEDNRAALVNEGFSGLIKLSWLAKKGQHGGYVEFSATEDRLFKVSLSMGFNFKPIN